MLFMKPVILSFEYVYTYIWCSYIRRTIRLVKALYVDSRTCCMMSIKGVNIEIILFLKIV